MFLCTLVGWVYLICIIAVRLFLNSSSCLPATKMQSQLLFLSNWCRKTLKFIWKNRIKYSKNQRKWSCRVVERKTVLKNCIILIHWIISIPINTPLPILIFILCKQVNKVLVLTRIVRFLPTCPLPYLDNPTPSFLFSSICSYFCRKKSLLFQSFSWMENRKWKKKGGGGGRGKKWKYECGENLVKWKFGQT